MPGCWPSDANVDGQDLQGRTALHGAAETGKVDVVHLLLRFRANVDLTDHQGRTTLHVAAKMLRPEVVRILLRVGHANPAGVSQCGGTVRCSVMSLW